MRRRATVRPLAAALLVLAASACGSKKSGSGPLHVASPAWEDQVIYFVMTDRFSNGDPRNDDQGRGEYDPSVEGKYSGGDLQGIIDRLDYIQGLGATAIWITPPVAAMWWDPLQQYGGYHGYWARHLEKVDEHLGTLDTYQALSRELHRRGMYLIQDVVPNHMGNFFTYCSDPSGTGCAPGSYDSTDVTKNFVMNVDAVPSPKPEQAPFDQDDARDPAQRAAAIYHWTPAISDYNDPNQELNYQISDLDDLNSENPVVRAALRSSYGYWIREVGVDGFRVDTAKFVPHDFWNDFFQSTDPAAPGMHAAAKATGRDRFFAFGEVYEVSDPMAATAEAKLSSYLGTPAAPELPAVLQFPLFADIGRVFAGGQPTAYLGYRLGKFMDPSIFPNPWATPTFIDNHDVRRFLAVGTEAGLAQALAFLFTVPGVPVVYYGTEQRFTETRAAMFKGGYLSGGVDHFDAGAAYYQKIKKLSALRRSSPVFTRGALDVLYDSAAGAGPLAYRRTHEGQTALVVMNTAGEKVLVSELDTGLPAGSVLEVLHSEQSPPAPVVGPGGRLTLLLPPRAVVIARATGQVVAPPPPETTITVTTPVEGQTFTQDVTIFGTVSPPGTGLQMVVDGYLDRASPVTVAADGTWSVVLPISAFPDGVEQHAVAFYASRPRISTPRFHFTSDVTFQGQLVHVDDPVGDDKGPSGTYTYPLNGTFGHQMDITGVTAEVGPTTLNLKITMAEMTTVWNPPNGFDHVAFNVYFELPGQAGVSVMPKLQASTPTGFTWRFDQFTAGWDNYMYSSEGATATSYGTPITAAGVKASASSRTVIFTYDRNALGLASWSGVRIYVATWDYDGITSSFRPLGPVAGEYSMGGGAPTDPLIMDDVPPITLP